MGTTADKLTYLNTTKGKIKDSINLTGAGITNQDTFRSYASLLKTGLISIINNGIDQLYSNFPKVSGTGSNLSLTPTYEAPMRSEIYYGDTLQNGTPTPSSPIDIQTATGLQNINITGKNLFDINTITDGKWLLANGNEAVATQYCISDFIPVIENEQYYLPKTDTRRLKYYDSNKQPLTTSDWDISSGTEGQIINVPSNAKYVRFSIHYTVVDINTFMFNKGSTPKTYEPYQSNTYEVNLGKNLSKIEDGTTTINGLTITVENGIITLNGTTTSSCVFKLTNGLDTISDSRPDTNWFSENVVDKLAGKVLSINNISGSGPSSSWAIRLFKSTTTYSYQYTPSTFVGDKVYTTGENISCICIFTNQNLTFDNYKIQIQLEKGTKSTSFSPYFTPIELNKIGDYKDSIKKSTGKNLFDDTLELGTISATGQNNTSTTNLRNVSYIEVKENTTYTISSNVSGSIGLRFYNNENTFLSSGTTNASPNTFTTPVNCTKLRIILINNTDTTTKVQLEVGSTTTSYEPYGKVWYIEKNINKKIFNGSNSDGTWAKQTGYYNCNANLGGIAGQGYTNYYSYGNLINENKFLITTNAFRVNDSTDTLENYITWLSTHNIELYYVSNTPTYTEITNTELLEDLENLYNANSKNGTTNINVSSEYLPFILNISALEMTD